MGFGSVSEDILHMKKSEVIYWVVSNAGHPVTPQEIREIIKTDFPELYGTEAHIRAVDKKQMTSLDHALLADIYTCVKTSNKFYIDKSVKPYKVSVLSVENDIDDQAEDLIPEDLSSDSGFVYVLSTGVYSADGKKILKIGFTTQEVQIRINQLYTTGSPFKFEEIKSYKVNNYVELEQALHKLLAPYRLSSAREFFNEDALEFIDSIVKIHFAIQERSSNTSV